MVNAEFFDALEQLEKEKGIPSVFEVMKNKNLHMEDE